MLNPLISVIIPVYNAEQFLHETLDSVCAQTYTNIEIIAVDDGSTDKSAEVIKRYPNVKYILRSNGGASRARNTGIQASSGDYIALLDHDDIWLPEKLKIQVEIASRHPEGGIIVCDGVWFSRDSLVSGHLLAHDIVRAFKNTLDGEVTKKSFYTRLLKGNPIWCNSQELLPRRTIDDIGLFVEKKMDYSAAYDYYLRIATRHPFIFHGHSLVRYRYHPLSQSGMMEFRQMKYNLMKINVLKEHLAKQLYPAGCRRYVETAYYDLVKRAAREAIRIAVPKNPAYVRLYLGRVFCAAPTSPDVLVCFAMSWLPQRLLMQLLKFLKRMRIIKQ